MIFHKLQAYYRLIRARVQRAERKRFAKRLRRWTHIKSTDRWKVWDDQY